MIRRRDGDDWLLFPQHDHALLSGLLAERIGPPLIQRPSARAVRGISLHDCGWPLHDDAPTLNAAGEPLDVFETPPAIAVRVWSASADRAAEVDPWCGLLVSLHVLNLSRRALTAERSARELFELHQFQHRQIELQEKLRPQAGLRIDRPLDHGLAPRGVDPREDELLFDFRLLRAMDQLSLALLRTENPFPSLEAIDAAPGGSELTCRATRTGPFRVAVNPWPFDAPRIESDISCRRLSARPFADVNEFRLALNRTAIETVHWSVEPG